MSAAISFYAGTSDPINNLNGSGLGFYGTGGFGTSVSVGSYQSRTYITNSAGTAQGPEACNVIWTHANSGILGQSGPSLNLLNIPNYQSTVNIRFTYDSAVQVQNARIKVYDRVSTAASASGVTQKVAEVIHPETSQGVTGSGDTAWTTFAPTDSGTVSMGLANSPGISGIYAGNGSSSARPDTRHDWYVLMSASPDSIGSKLYGMYVSLEYL